MLYLIGLGLGGVKDITYRGIEAAKSCDKIYLEAYTSTCADSIELISKFIEKDIIIAHRQDTEDHIDDIIKQCHDKNIAFLVIGDPLSATTHTDMMLRAKRSGVNVKIVHNASILTAISACGLQLYKFGETASIVRWTDNWMPDSFFDKIIQNFERNLHTLCLLDIKIKELSIEGIMRNKPIYEPDYFQSAKEAANIILKIIKMRNTNICINADNQKILLPDESNLCVVCSRIGWEDEKISCMTLKSLSTIDDEFLGGFPHSLIIPAKTLHFCEEEFLKEFVVHYNV